MVRSRGDLRLSPYGVKYRRVIHVTRVPTHTFARFIKTRKQPSPFQCLIYHTKMNTSLCIDILRNKSGHLLLFYLAPVDDEPLWQPRSRLWCLMFVLFTAIYSLFYLKLGIVSLTMFIKRNCARLPTKTFAVIYSCLAVLGFSRLLMLVLDPLGIMGWLMNRFSHWVILSRLLAALGFPSITASYTLVFLTLYKATDPGASRLWLQNWRVVVSIAAVHYAIPLVAEGIANIASYPALISVMACEAFFVLWGVLIGVSYLFAGGRLRRKLKGQCSKTITRSLSRLERRPPVGLKGEEYRRHYKAIANTVRKIGLISYGTAILGILYAAARVASLTAILIFLFQDCTNSQGNPVVWLSIKTATTTLEIPLAFVMLYSVTDVQGVLKRVKRTCCCCHHSNRQDRSDTNKRPPTVKNTLPTLVISQPALAVSQSTLPPLGQRFRTGSEESILTTYSTLTQFDNTPVTFTSGTLTKTQVDTTTHDSRDMDNSSEYYV